MARKKQQDVKKKRNSAGQFCKVYVNVIRELYHDYRTATAGILLLSLILVNADFIELKLLKKRLSENWHPFAMNTMNPMLSMKKLIWPGRPETSIPMPFTV